MTLPRRPLALFACSIMLVSAALAGPLRPPRPTAVPSRAKSSTSTAEKEKRRASIAKRSTYSARIITTTGTLERANRNLNRQPEGQVRALALSPPKNTSISGLKDPRIVDAEVRSRVNSILGRGRPSETVQELRIRTLLARQFSGSRLKEKLRDVER